MLVKNIVIERNDSVCMYILSETPCHLEGTVSDV